MNERDAQRCAFSLLLAVLGVAVICIGGGHSGALVVAAALGVAAVLICPPPP